MNSTRAFGHIQTLLAAAISLVALVFLWQTAIGPNLVAKRFAVVEPGKVYRSGELTPAAFRRVQEGHGIKTILDLGANAAGSPGDRLEQRTADALHITRLRFDLSGDGSGNPNVYVRALQVMNDPEMQPVLVHCGAGTERTGAAVMLYRHIIQGIPLDAAGAEAESRGHDPDRNPVLAKVIRDWAGPIERAFRSGGQVPGADPLPELATSPPVN